MVMVAVGSGGGGPTTGRCLRIADVMVVVLCLKELLVTYSAANALPPRSRKRQRAAAAISQKRRFLRFLDGRVVPGIAVNGSTVDGRKLSSPSSSNRAVCPVMGGNGGKSSSLPSSGGKGVNGNVDRIANVPASSRGSESVGEKAVGASSSPV